MTSEWTSASVNQGGGLPELRKRRLSTRASEQQQQTTSTTATRLPMAPSSSQPPRPAPHPARDDPLWAWVRSRLSCLVIAILFVVLWMFLINHYNLKFWEEGDEDVLPTERRVGRKRDFRSLPVEISDAFVRETEELKNFLPGYEGVENLIAIGDLHGDLERAKDAFQLAKVIDSDGNWIAGEATVVQTGDVFDRGDNSIEILEFLVALKGKAREQGGRLIQLLGNHEVMNLLGNYRFVHYEENMRWGGNNVWGHMMSNDHFYGNYLRNLPTAVKIDDTVFVHAGLSPSHARLGIPAVNAEVSMYLKSGEFGDKGGRWITGDKSPHWTRLYNNWKADEFAVGELDEAGCKALNKSLGILGASRMVIGHNVQIDTGVPGVECNQRLFIIDSGISRAYGGHVSAWRLDQGKITILTPTKTTVLDPPPPPAQDVEGAHTNTE